MIRLGKVGSGEYASAWGDVVGGRDVDSGSASMGTDDLRGAHEARGNRASAGLAAGESRRSLSCGAVSSSASMNMRPSFDNIQLAAVLLPCARCGARYYVTVPREGWICRACANTVRTR